jgi:serine/threonine protein kinase
MTSVILHDFGSEDDLIFIAMEHVAGKTVAELIREKGPMDVNEALAIIREVAEGLEVTSHKSIVHRDIKPQNLMVTVDGGVKIMDFGIAKSTGKLKLTETGFLGTPFYISPEQAEGEELDIRSDIYSVGVVLWEMLTGRVLFDGDSPVEIAMKHISAPVPPLHLYREDIAVAVESLINTCLQKRPQDRFPTPTALIRAVDDALEQRIVAEPAKRVEIEGRVGEEERYLATLVTKRGRFFPIMKPVVSLGRTDPANRIFPEIDLSSEDPGKHVSRRHARILRKGNQWFLVEEVGVRHGTYVNGRKISPGVETPLKNGDEVRLAKVSLTFQLSEQRISTR